MSLQDQTYTATVLKHWNSFEGHIRDKKYAPSLDGHNLSLSHLLAIARYGAKFNVGESTLENLEKSHAALQDSVGKGEVIYGVNTGFGGSAHTRTDRPDALQKTLLREFHNGVLVPAGTDKSPSLSLRPPHGASLTESQQLASRLDAGLHVQNLSDLTCMPTAWVRAAIVVRLNSLINGCSGVRRSIIERMMHLVERDIIPHVPIHGSISASGDLAPSSYIGNAVQGKPNVAVTVGSIQGQPRVTTAQRALAEAGLQAEKVVAKEALAIMNGTAFSSAVGAIAIHEAHGLTVMSMVLTAMSVEALKGNAESFDPFFGHVRPHGGQIDAAKTILGFLKGSKLTNDHGPGGAGTLAQDRYSIRTAAQWLSPTLEDLQLAHHQMTVECNSVTDNPLVDTSPGPGKPRHLHGGNFQAKAVTSAMEKIRLNIQSIGRMLFVQCTEIINPATNRGLAPNLVSDEPSESFMMKSIDIMIAALQSELGFLGNPAGTHVQTAEMGNQALNSLALISARYTLTAIDVASKLVAAHLLVACQALDLRVITRVYYQQVHSQMHQLANEWFDLLCLETGASKDALPNDMPERVEHLQHLLWTSFRSLFEETTIMNTSERFAHISKSLHGHLMESIPDLPTNAKVSALPRALQAWTTNASETLRSTYVSVRDAYLASPNPEPYLGRASQKMYAFVRNDLGVPFLNTGALTHKPGRDDAFETDMATESTPTISTFMTRLYTAIRSGALIVPAMQCLEQVHTRWDAARL